MKGFFAGMIAGSLMFIMVNTKLIHHDLQSINDTLSKIEVSLNKR